MPKAESQFAKNLSIKATFRLWARWFMRLRSRTPVGRNRRFLLVLPVAACLIALGLRSWLHESLELGTTFPLFYTAVVISVAALGLWAGLIAMAVSIALDIGAQLWVYHAVKNNVWMAICLFAVNSTVISLIITFLKNTLERERRAKRELEISERLFRALAETIDDRVVYIVDLKRDEISYISPAFERIYGRPVKDQNSARESFFQTLHPDEHSRFVKSRSKEDILAEKEYRIVRPGGDVRWIRNRPFPMRDPDGEVRRITGVVEDITLAKAAAEESLRANQELRQSETKYRTLFTMNPTPMLIYDQASHRVRDVNQAAIRHFGYSREEFIKMRITDLVPRDEVDRLLKWAEREYGEGGVIVHEAPIQVRKKDGVILDVEVAGSNANYDEFNKRNTRLVVLKDVTERVGAEAQLRQAMAAADQAKKVAEGANQAKSQFLANMSHEIRTPLGAILGYAELIADPNQTPADRQECLATILRNGDQLSRVINDILDLSKIESEKLEIEYLEFSPSLLIEEVTALLRLEAVEKGLDLELGCRGEIPCLVQTDPTRLRQILLNLLGNAIKFTSRGKIKLMLSTKIDVDPLKPALLEFFISDSGPGIAHEHRDRLFQPFSQADTSTTRLFGGTGLGLALSKRLAEALGGDVQLKESQLGVGSTFYLSIDIGASGKVAAGEMQSDLIPRPSEPGMSKFTANFDPNRKQMLLEMNVLVVEDAPDNRVLMSRFVKATGANVVMAEDGLAALEAASTNIFDLILMDIQMPKLDGFAAVSRLRQSGYSRPIVALTAHAMKGDRERCLAAGFDDHLVKPLNRAALITVLTRYAPVKNPPSHQPSNRAQAADEHAY